MFFFTFFCSLSFSSFRFLFLICFVCLFLPSSFFLPFLLLSAPSVLLSHLPSFCLVFSFYRFCLFPSLVLSYFDHYLFTPYFFFPSFAFPNSFIPSLLSCLSLFIVFHYSSALTSNCCAFRYHVFLFTPFLLHFLSLSSVSQLFSSFFLLFFFQSTFSLLSVLSHFSSFSLILIYCFISALFFSCFCSFPPFFSRLFLLSIIPGCCVSFSLLVASLFFLVSCLLLASALFCSLADSSIFLLVYYLSRSCIHHLFLFRCCCFI